MSLISDVCANFIPRDADSQQAIINKNESITLVACDDNIPDDEATQTSETQNDDGSYTICNLKKGKKYSVFANAYTYSDKNISCDSEDDFLIAENETYFVDLDRSGKISQESNLL